MKNLQSVDWSNIPAPEDDGGADHLQGLACPSLALLASNGSVVNLSQLTGRTLVYIYPMTGRPDTALPEGWDLIPGARGCTPQSCSFRDHAKELADLGIANIFGLSSQNSEYQQEAAERLELPFALLSDIDLQFSSALNLPTMNVQDMTLLKRMTLIIDKGVITHVIYPIFPPDQNASMVLEWLSSSSSELQNQH